MKPLYRLFYRLNRLRWSVTRPISVGVRLLLICEDSVLLLRHTYLPGWYLPGGGVKRGETLEESARREAREEVGARLEQLDLFGIYTSLREGKTDHVALFLCTSFVIESEGDGEIERFGSFPLQHLPPETSPATARRVAEYLAGRRGIYGEW